MIAALLLAVAAPGPYDLVCQLGAEATAVAIVAREAGVPLSKVLKVFDDERADPVARRLMRAATLEVYSEPRHGGPVTRADEERFISQNTAACILQFEREASSDDLLQTERARRNLTGVKP